MFKNAYGPSITMGRKQIRQIEEVMRFHSNPTLKAFLKGCKERRGEVPSSTVKMVMETVNEVFWNDMSLKQKEKDKIRDLYMMLKRVHEKGSRDPEKSRKRSPKKPSMTLEEIKRRQEQRRRSSRALKDRLICWGYRRPEFRDDLRPILDYLMVMKRK